MLKKQIYDISDAFESFVPLNYHNALVCKSYSPKKPKSHNFGNLFINRL